MFCTQPSHFNLDDNGVITGDFTHVIVGKPDFDDSILIALGMVDHILGTPIIHLQTENRFLPKILVEAGHFESNSAAIRQNKTWKIAFEDDAREFHVIRLAKNGKRQNTFVAIFVGPKNV